MPKKLKEPDSLRPIGARALKSCIDTLRPHLADATVLDLYAGQGRFGLTASLEGIKSVHFVELDRGLASQLKSQVYSPRFPKNVAPEIYCLDAFKFLEGSPKKYDIIFADPPFELWNSDYESELLTRISKHLISKGIFIVKHPTRMTACVPTKELRIWKNIEFGESRLQYFVYGEEEQISSQE